MFWLACITLLISIIGIATAITLKIETADIGDTILLWLYSFIFLTITIFALFFTITDRFTHTYPVVKVIDIAPSEQRIFFTIKDKIYYIDEIGDFNKAKEIEITCLEENIEIKEVEENGIKN